MLKRLTITSLLGVALLFSQGGVLLIAALCPHLRLAVPVCGDMTGDAVDHSQMAHHEMEPGNSLLDGLHEANTILWQGGGRPCSHCSIHGQTKSSNASVKTAETVKRTTEISVPDTVSAFAPVITSDVAVLTAKEHGPPGEASRPKHVIFSTFRI